MLCSGIEKQSDDDLARMNDYKDFQQKMPKEEVPDWEMFTPRKVYSYDKNSPEIGMLNPTKDGLNNVLGQTMTIINKEARKVLHRTLEFKRLNHGYKRYHPLYGMQYMLDLLMKVKILLLLNSNTGEWQSSANLPITWLFKVDVTFSTKLNSLNDFYKSRIDYCT